MKKLIKWLTTPLIPIRPQSSPIGLIAIFGILLLVMNWPLSENTIEAWEIFAYLGLIVFGVISMKFVEWYKDNSGQ